MKKLLFMLAFCVTTNLHAAESGNEGRFRLYDAEVVTAQKDDKDGQWVSVNRPFIFKIDTVTGKTWRYHHAASNDETNEGWYEVISYQLEKLPLKKQSPAPPRVGM